MTINLLECGHYADDIFGNTKCSLCRMRDNFKREQPPTVDVSTTGPQTSHHAIPDSALMTTVVSFGTPDVGAVKHDSGKPDFTYISYELLELVAKVREFGAKKYSRNNWQKGFKTTRSLAAALRHIYAYLSGEDLDPESGLSHLGHAVCCLEHEIYSKKHHPKNDDRKSVDSSK